MDYYEGLRKLKENTLPPCLILEGKEPYLIEDFLQKLREKILPEGSESLSLTRLEGAQFDQEALQASLGTLSLFGDERLVVVRSAQDIKWSPAMKKALQEERFEGVQLVFVIEKENASAKSLRKLAPSVVCGSIDRPQMERWIQKEARQAGKTLSREALRKIIEGSRYFEYRSKIDLFFVKSELDKLFATPATEIEVGRVRSMLAIPPEEEVFNMLEAITESNSESALEMYANLRASGQTDKILALLIRNYEQLLIARIYADASQSQDGLGAALGLSSGFLLRKIQKQAMAHTKEELLALLDLCLTTLHRSRQETVDLGEVVERLILQLLQKAKGDRR